MSTETPQYSDTFSTEQRDKLLEFIDRFDRTYGDGSFERDDTWMDAEILAVAMRTAQILGYENERLEALFCREFGIAGVTEGQLGDWVTLIMLLDVERKIRCAAGGRS